MSQFNTARYLSNVLDFICKQEQSNRPAYSSIGAALEISKPDKNPNELSQLLILLSTVEEEVRNLKKSERSSEYLIVIKEFHSFLIRSGLFQLKWDELRDFIRQRNLVLIFDACAYYIASEQLNFDLSEAQLKDFLEQAESLLKEVVNSDLQIDVKKYLIVRLEEICSAMRHYSTGGSKHLSLVVDASIGGLYLRQFGILQDKEKPVYKKILQFLLTLGGLLDLGANVQGYALPKAEEIVRFFLPPSQ